MVQQRDTSARNKPTAQKSFVDRESFQEAFEKALDRNPEQTYKVLVYYGVGGIGKTSLIQQLESNLKSINPNAMCVTLDFTTSHFRQQDEALFQLVYMLGKDYKIPFPTYDIAYKVYWKKVHPNQALIVKEIPFFEDGSIISEIISALGDMPVVGVVPKITKIALKGHSFIQTWWTMRGENTLRKLESMQPHEILNEFPIYFAQDFADYLKKKNQPAVIFLDTYEALWESNKDVGHYTSRDAWIRDLIAELPSPGNILWVICGRERLRWADIKNDNWGDYLEQHPIGNLENPDICDFLINWGITDSKIQDAIVESSEGVPFYLDLAVEIYYKKHEPIPDDFTGTHEKLLERFLRYLDRSEKVALEVLSAARFWDRELFDALLTTFDTGYPRQRFSELMKHSFINEAVISGKATYSMHQLMSKNLQDFQDEEDRQRVHEYLFEYYSGQLPEKAARTISEQNKTTLREAFYHRSKVADITQFSKWFYDAAKIFNTKSQYNLLTDLYQALLNLQEEDLGTNHLDVATTCNNLALLYQDQGKYEEAEPLFKRALKISEEVLGPNHPYVATTCNNLALLYQDQGKYEEAEPLYKRALKIYEEVLGPNNPDVATTCNNLAGLYQAQGKYEEAEPLYKRAFKISEEVLGTNNPDVATTCNNLAVLYQDQGKYEEAEPLFMRAFKIREEVLGPNHPYVAATCNNLAVLYQDRGKYEEAEPLLKRAFKIREEVLGPNHPYVAATCNNLAGLYQDQGKYEEAEPLYMRALKIYEEVLGPNHPYVAATCNNLASLYKDQGKYEEAEPLLKRAFKIREEVLGPNHPYVATTCNNLAVLYQVQGKYEEAEPLFMRDLKISEEVLSPNHPYVATTCNNLASLYQAQGKYEEAEPLYMRAFKIREEVLGPNHPYVATTCNNLALLYKDQGKYEEAEPLYMRALKIYEEVLGINHPDVATTCNNLVGLYQAQGKYDEAELLYKRALKIREES